MSKRGRFGMALVAAAAMAVAAVFPLAARASDEVTAPRLGLLPPPLETWLSVEKFSMLASARPNGDSFIIQATFNCAPHSFAPAQDLTLRIDNAAVIIPAVDWTQKGTTNRYGMKTANFNAQIEYWIGESSRCELKMSGKNMDLHSTTPDWPSIPIELILGTAFDETQVAQMDARRAKTWMVAVGPLPSFVIDMLGIKRNLTAPDKDAAIVSGRCYLDSGFDPAVSGVDAQLGPYTLSIPVGAIQLSNNLRMMSYHGVINGAKVSLSGDAATGKFQIRVTGIDLSGMTNPITVRLTLTNIAGAEWQYAPVLQEDIGGKLFRY